MLRDAKVERPQPLSLMALGWEVSDIRRSIAGLTKAGVV